jgi:probable HAF family extracellular repeat protein
LDTSGAFDINEAGEVVGNSSFRAFRWTSGAGMQNLGVLPGFDFSGATGISNNGHIVGYCSEGAISRSFLWTSGGGMQDLGDLPGGNDEGQALGVNDSGQVVGWSSGSPSGGSRAYIWTSGGGLTDLNDRVTASGFGWSLMVASAINNAGQIVGTGPNPSGDYHGFLLTPVQTTVLAFTEFDDPPLGVANFNPGAANDELGFVTASSTSGGASPLLGVVVDGGGGRVFTHRSIDATTTFDDVNIANYDDIGVSLRMQVANADYEAGDFVRAYVTNGSETIDIANFEGPSIDDVAGDGFLEYRIAIPNDWTVATLVITSSTDSSQAFERFDFDSIEFRGVFAIPEPATWGMTLAALVIARRARYACRARDLHHTARTACPTGLVIACAANARRARYACRGRTTCAIRHAERALPVVISNPPRRPTNKA